MLQIWKYLVPAADCFEIGFHVFEIPARTEGSPA